MLSWSPAEWSVFFVAVAAFVASVAATVTSAYSAIQSRKAKERGDANSAKIDENTKITRAVGVAAATNARDARVASESMAETVKQKLNGGLDHAVAQAMAPIIERLEESVRRVEKLEVEFGEFQAYAHKRNHDVLDWMQSQTNTLQAVYAMLERSQKAGGGGHA